MRWLFFTLSFVNLLFGDSFTSAITENDPSTFVDGVSMITGDFYLAEEDYLVAGAEPISLRRYYLSQNASISAMPHTRARIARDSKSIYLEVCEPNGTGVIYELDLEGKRSADSYGIGDEFYHKKRARRFIPHEFFATAKGISNTASGTISAKTQLKNQYILFDPSRDKKGKSFTLHAADGTIRRYVNEIDQKKSGYPFQYFYRLAYEKLPNGHIRHYQWNQKNELLGLRTSNSQDTKTFTHVSNVSPSFSSPQKTFHGSDGRQLHLSYNACLATIDSPEYPTQHFTYEGEATSRPLLKTIALPNGRKIAIQYDSSDRRRVSALLAPLGPEGALLPYYTFSYTPNEKTSHATDILGNLTSYFWDENLRIQRIDHFSGKDSLHNSESYVWEETLLRCKVLYDEKRTPLFARTLTYDGQGNILQETLCGNFSGEGAALHLDSKGYPLKDGVERVVTKSVYSKDGRNLLLQKEEQSGLVTNYIYHPQVNLPIEKRLLEKENLLSRTLYEYDQDFILIREVTEEGGRRAIRQITPRQIEPYIGLPDWIEEKYWDGATEVVLRKVQLHYSDGAQISQKDVYDANRVFRYSLFYKYDEKGRVLEETNPLGQKRIHRYDAVGNQIYTKEFSARVETHSTYDLMNRLIQKIEQGDDGVRREFHYEYDQKSRLIAETDPYGGTTRYRYNAQDQRTETTLPSGAVLRSSFDCAGNQVVKIDGEGNETHLTYNSRNQATRTIYADGAVEKSIYNLDGTLKEQIDPLGVRSLYQRDALGRLIEKKLLSPEGKCLAQETFRYQGTLLVAQTNAEGVTRLVTYDGAGRKVSEESAGECVRLVYDELGRVQQKIEGDLVTSYSYDLLNRLIEERQGDLRITQYGYDSAGVRTAIIRSVNGQTAVERMEYDSMNRLVKRIDPLGQVTTTIYGDKVSTKTEIDPLELQTIQRFDSQERLISLEKRKNGKTLLLEEFKYDRNNNKILQINNIPSRHIRWEYDRRNRVAAQIEGDTKITRYEYNLRGECVQLQKPDGVCLTYRYNPLGHLTALHSSDGTVDHQMVYNRLGQLLQFDGIERTLDGQGRVIEERFPQGFSIQNSYDNRARKSSTSIPQVGIQISYEYGALDLNSVRCGALTHQYIEYDRSGNLLKEELIGGLGTTSYQHDLLSRTTNLQAPSFSQTVERFDAVGNVLEMRIRNEERQYTYDESYALTSESAPFPHTYLNDALYNRLKKDSQQFEVDGLNQLVGVFTYGPNGNPIDIEGINLVYDALDRLIRIQGKDFVETFTHDYLNRCLSRSTLKESSYFLYQGQNEIGSLNAEGQLQELRVLGAAPHAEIGAAVAIWLQGSWYAPIHDLQGNVATLLPLNKGAPTQYSYSAFGEERINGEAPNPWRFASKRTDPFTGFANYGRRYYLPKYGRWLTCDPLGFTVGANLYAFVKNNPLTILDEYGLLDVGLWRGARQRSDPSYGYRPQSGDFRKTVGGMTHAVADFGISSVHFVQTGLTYIGAEQLEFGSRMKERMFSSMEREQAYDMRRTDRWMRQQFSVGSVDPVYDSSRNATALGLEIGSLLYGGVGLVKCGYATWRWGMSAYNAGRRGLGAFSAVEGLGVTRVPVGSSQSVMQKVMQESASSGTRKRLVPSSQARGAHTAFRRNPETGEIIHYETFQPQTNFRNPSMWESVKRYDSTGRGHHNKILQQNIGTPHVHDPNFPGEVRIPEFWEIPS